MSRLDRATVVEALRADEVLDRLGICARSDQRWRGRWLRGRRCARTDHNSDAFGINGAGFWHCWSCDEGGDLIDLVAASENLDAKNDFPRVLEVAAQIAGVEPEADFDPFAPTPTPTPTRRVRPPLPAPVPVEKRVDAAKARAAWAWGRLYPAAPGTVESYLRSRGLRPESVLARETIKSTPLRIEDSLRRRIDAGDPTLSPDLLTLWRTMGVRRGTLAIVVPVRSVDPGGRFVDLRARRVDPSPGMPKIMSMVGNITVAPAERGKTRRLIGCYGDPSSIDSDTVVLTEGLADYLTGLQLWPNAQVLGAPEAGTLGVLAEHVAARLAERGGDSRLLIVEQADPPRTTKDGRVLPGAADAAVNEDHNSAAKEAIRLLGPRRVGWLYCSVPHPNGSSEDVAQEALGGKPAKDLNDLVRCGIDVSPMIAWWSDLGPPA